MSVWIVLSVINNVLEFPESIEVGMRTMLLV